MSGEKQSNGLSVYVSSGYEDTLERVAEELKKEGFGILTEIDVKATLKQKLDLDFRPYKILGACNPPLAHRALEIAPEVGLLLPCNVTVAEETDGRILVSFMDPMLMVQVIEQPALQEVASEADARLRRVAKAMREG